MTHLEDEIAKINQAIRELRTAKSKLKKVEANEKERKRRKHKRMYT